MEGVVSLSRVPGPFGSLYQKQSYSKVSPSNDNRLLCGNGYASIVPCKPPTLIRTSPASTSFGSCFVYHFHGCQDLFTVSASECLGRTVERRSSAYPICTSSSMNSFPWLGCNCMSSGSRGYTRGFFSSSRGDVVVYGQWRKIWNVDGKASDVHSSRAIFAMTVTFPGPLETKSLRCFRLTCLLQEFGGINQSTQLFVLSVLGRGKGKRGSRGGLHSHQRCEATGPGGTGQTGSDEENSEPAQEQGPPSVPGKNADLPVVSPVEPEAPEVDWRAFRARLVVTEHATTSSENGSSSDEAETSSMPVSHLGKRWAHPILAPEAGCVLIATDKIDGQQSFERSVILLLSPGSSNPREGPYGLILNRPLSWRIKDIKPKDRTLIKFFGNCQVHHGGPLDEDMFLLLHGTEGVKGYREVIPGVYYGAPNGLEEIMKGKRPVDYRFFFGYSGWGVEQLQKEIDAGLWCVAACSTDLITGHSAAGLWEEILLLMGGKYGELSKRPRRRHF